MNRIKKLIQQIKKANFEQTLIVLIGLFLLGVIFISLTSSSATTNTPITINPGTGTSTNTTIDPTVITKAQKNLYYYQNGTIEVDGTNGVYFYQTAAPTPEEISKIKTELGLVSLDLVDESYKSVKRTAPDELVFPEEQILDEPRQPGNQNIQEGMSGEGLVD